MASLSRIGGGILVLVAVGVLRAGPMVWGSVFPSFDAKITTLHSASFRAPQQKPVEQETAMECAWDQASNDGK